MGEYEGVCARGHRSYLRLVGVSGDAKGTCTTCGGPAELVCLPPPVLARVRRAAADMAIAFGGTLDAERVEAAILSVLLAGPPVAEPSSAPDALALVRRLQELRQPSSRR
jgi:hypothetical protein